MDPRWPRTAPKRPQDGPSQRGSSQQGLNPAGIQPPRAQIHQTSSHQDAHTEGMKQVRGGGQQQASSKMKRERGSGERPSNRDPNSEGSIHQGPHRGCAHANYKAHAFFLPCCLPCLLLLPPLTSTVVDALMTTTTSMSFACLVSCLLALAPPLLPSPLWSWICSCQLPCPCLFHALCLACR